jgi:hypothetical protein
MAMNFKRALLAGVLLAAVVVAPSNAPGCGQFFAGAVFTDTRIPPLPDFVKGRLGVLLPSFTQRYLFVAYRYLSGQPLTSGEVESFVSPSDLSNPSSEGESVWRDSFFVTPAMNEWLDARAKIPGIGPSPRIDIHRNDTGGSTGEWRYFVNCSEDAFKTAAGTLGERAKALGIGHPGIRSWALAQDTVFSNCAKGEAIPEPADAQLPQPLRYDRAYQIAAAHFYCEHYDTAAEMFRAIAADAGSPWSGMAPYLAVRCLIRKATVPQKYGVFDRNALMEAEGGLRAILTDKNRAFLHTIAAKLEAYVELRLHPLDHIRALAERLQRRAGSDNFGQDLIDYQYLMGHFDLQPDFTRESASQTSDMTDWLLAFPSGNPAHALVRWKSTGSAAWLLAAMVRLPAGDPDAKAVMDAAQNLPKNSTAYPTAQYHRIRLLMESGKEGDARDALDALLPGLRTSLQNSSLNLFLSQRLRLARSFDEFLQFAPRVPQVISMGSLPVEQEEYMGPSTPLFDADAVEVLNRGLPLALLSRAAVSTRLPSHLRKLLVRAAWVRAVLISNGAVASELAGELERVYPELKSDLEAWRSAGDADSRQFALAVLLLHFPGLSPYLQSGVPPRGRIAGISDFRENWWCGFNAGGNLDSPTGFRYSTSRFQEKAKPPQQAKLPEFLTDADKAAFLLEWRKLAAVPTAPDYFGRIVLSWASKHPKDERVPEALHLVVKSTRFGCGDAASGDYSRSAFRLLHARYPDTAWAKMTPFWFR